MIFLIIQKYQNVKLFAWYFIFPAFKKAQIDVK